MSIYLSGTLNNLGAMDVINILDLLHKLIKIQKNDILFMVAMIIII